MRLFEFGDLPWVPSLYHIYLRKYLIIFYKIFGYYKLWVPGLQAFIQQTNSDCYMEYCSGSGEALQLIHQHLDKNTEQQPKFLLSDIQPHPEFVAAVNSSENSDFHYIEQPINAVEHYADYNVPKLFINSFHHFASEQARKILLNNLNNNNEVIIFEYVRNTPLGYLSMLIGPVVVFFTLPFVVKLKDLPLAALFTYIIPLSLLMIFWDGLVSCKHEYSEKKLRELVSDVDVPVKVSNKISRNLFYPMGVSVTSFTF